MSSKRLVHAALALVLAALAQGASAQEPGNRELHRFSVVPDPAGGGAQIVTAHWSVDVQTTPIPLDLSTEVELSINGTAVQSITASVLIDGGAGGVCQAGPPCSGTCGTGTVDGEAATMRCFADCDAAGCVCDCGIWIDTPFDPMTIASGDVIEVLLRPSPGAAPDNESNDNGLDEPYEGEPLAWNRGVVEVDFTQVAGGGYDIEAMVGMSWEGLSGMLDMDTTVELRVNGVPVSEQNVPGMAEQTFDQGCFTAGCGAQCGLFNGVPSFCDPFLWWSCGCGAGTIALFPNVPVSPGDEIMVLLRPAPGALPELPGFGEDDERELTCCEVVGVGDAHDGARPWGLGQNRPNPFNPTTTIPFTVDLGGSTRLRIFDGEGRVVRTLLDRHLTAGEWTATWDGRMDTGGEAASGTYFYRLETPGGEITRRMTLLK